MGDVFIYLVANWTNSFIEFAKGVPEADLTDPQKLPRTQQDLLETFIPTWNGNMHRIDGLVPMIATVNNSTGLCHVDATGTITYLDNENKQQTIKHDFVSYDNNSSFNFKRLMAKLTMNFITDNSVNKSTTAKFVPQKFRLLNGATYIAPTPDAWPNSDPKFMDLLMKIQDTDASNFSTQSPNSFTVYIPANLEEASRVSITKWSDRELMRKNSAGKNIIYPEGSDLAGKYFFLNAPQYASYMEVTGKYSDPEHDIISAETRFYIHLGDFGNKKDPDALSDFNVKRDHHYTYNVRVQGVNNIIVESKDTTPEAETDPNIMEINPAEDGLVYIGGLRAYCDAHYDQVEMRLCRNNFTKDYAIVFANTPFGNVSTLYYPKGSIGPDGKPRKKGEYKFLSKKINTIEKAIPHLKWVRLRKQTKAGEFAKYPSPQEDTPQNMITIFDALDKTWSNKDKNQSDYYTAFIDEYYYTKHPDPSITRPVKLKEFVNKADRSIALGQNIYISKDGTSVSVDAITVVYQKAIATFYDLNDKTRNKYGVETISETGKFTSYGSPSQPGQWFWNGLSNTLSEGGSDYSNCVNWKKNGWLLAKDKSGKEILVDQGQNRLTNKKAYLACMTRNRDLNGNGTLEKEEIRWYNPGLHQILGLWIGEHALPREAALYTGILTASTQKEYSGLVPQSLCPIYTSTYGKEGYARVLWAEEGASYGRENQAQLHGGEIRAIRNLGADIPTEDSYAINPDFFYEYNKEQKVIEVFLASVSLRGFSMGELEPHTERSVVNKLYKKFQLATHPYYYKLNRNCAAWPDWLYKYNQSKITNLIQAKTDLQTEATKYKGQNAYGTTTEPWPTGATRVGGWRLFNQRELAVMFMADPRFFGDHTPSTSSDCTNSAHVGNVHIHNWRETWHPHLHCRTSFTLNTAVSTKLGVGIYNNYTECGFWYDTERQKIECADPEETAGYFCVRDVQ